MLNGIIATTLWFLAAFSMASLAMLVVTGLFVTLGLLPEQ